MKRWLGREFDDDELTARRMGSSTHNFSSGRVVCSWAQITAQERSLVVDALTASTYHMVQLSYTSTPLQNSPSKSTIYIEHTRDELHRTVIPCNHGVGTLNRILLNGVVLCGSESSVEKLPSPCHGSIL